MRNESPRGSIRWHMEADGNGTADVFSVVDGDEVVQSAYTFDSLDRVDQIPPDLANLIRNDGRPSGVIP